LRRWRAPLPSAGVSSPHSRPSGRGLDLIPGPRGGDQGSAMTKKASRARGGSPPDPAPVARRARSCAICWPVILSRHELRDPALHDATITVTEVRISPPISRGANRLRHCRSAARMWPEILAGAAGAGRGFMRGLIARELDLRYVPSLRFMLGHHLRSRQPRIEALLPSSRYRGATSPAPRSAARTGEPGGEGRRWGVGRGRPPDPWLGRPRQAARLELEPGPSAPSRRITGRGQGGAWRHARPAGDRSAADRSSARPTKTVPPGRWRGRKTYRFTPALGARRARQTDDAEGVVVATERRAACLATAIAAALPGLQPAPSLQTPPAYSAIKLGGQRAYKLARGPASKSRWLGGPAAGRDRRPAPDRRGSMADHAEFEMETGKGAYVRAPWARPPSRPALGNPRLCQRAAPPGGRAVHPGTGDFAG